MIYVLFSPVALSKILCMLNTLGDWIENKNINSDKACVLDLIVTKIAEIYILRQRFIPSKEEIKKLRVRL